MRPSEIKKYSATVQGRKTSISLEPQFWRRLKEIAVKRGISRTFLINEIRANKTHANLSSAIRLYTLNDALSQLQAAMPPRLPETLPPTLHL